MVNAEILGGIKLALSKGESLKRAMMTFYNAGYKREEIEEAARIAQQQHIEPVEKLKVQPKPIQKIFSKGKPVQKISSYGQQPKVLSKKVPEEIQEEKVEIKKPVQEKPEEKKLKPQKISKYGEKPRSKPKIILVIFIFILFLFLGAIVTIFLFKQELIDFFSRIS